MPVALITGAARGLGKQLAITLAAQGYSIAANYNSSEREAEQLIKMIGGSALALRADVGNIASVRVMAETIRQKFGRLDVIINNAGIAKDNLLIRQTEPEWDSIIRTNLTGCFNVISAMSLLMIQSGGGHIVNISSRSGLKGNSGQAAYSASKAAILGLTVSAAREFSEYNIRVNAVLPGYMMTAMGSMACKAAEIAQQESFLGKFSHPEEVADCISHLLKTGNITGQIFNLDSRAI